MRSDLFPRRSLRCHGLPRLRECSRPPHAREPRCLLSLQRLIGSGQVGSVLNQHRVSGEAVNEKQHSG